MRSLDRTLPMKGWACRCGFKNESEHRKCRGCQRAKPPKRKPKHMKALENSYEAFREFNAEVHGPAFGGEWAPEDCGVCGRKPKDSRHMDRDHGHDKSENSHGRMRGLACPGDWGCNKVMSKLTLERARLVVAYLERVEAYYGQELENAA